MWNMSVWTSFTCCCHCQRRVDLRRRKQPRVMAQETNRRISLSLSLCLSLLARSLHHHRQGGVHARAPRHTRMLNCTSRYYSVTFRALPFSTRGGTVYKQPRSLRLQGEVRIPTGWYKGENKPNLGNCSKPHS